MRFRTSWTGDPGKELACTVRNETESVYSTCGVMLTKLNTAGYASEIEFWSEAGVGAETMDAGYWKVWKFW